MILEENKCYDMCIAQGSDERTRFKVKGIDSHGNVTGIECKTGKEVTFNINELYTFKLEGAIEIDCDDC